MPYELGTIWNVTSKYIYNTLDKNIGIGTTTPISTLDVYGDIAEKGIYLETKYQLKPEHNKKYDLIVREDLDIDDSELIIWYKFNKENFTSNFTSNLFQPDEADEAEQEHYGDLIPMGTGTRSNLQKEYYVGTGSAEINDELYYKIHMSANQFDKQKYTFCFWLFLNEECNDNTDILYLRDTSTSTDTFYFKYNTYKLIIYKDQNTCIEYYRSLDKNKWHHITIIIDDTDSDQDKKGILLIDGIPIDSNPTSTISTVLRGGTTGTADIYLGNTTNSINGYIDDFRIYESNLPIEYIRTNIIGKITKITPGNISANGNYGIDIVNYSSNVNIGTENMNVDLRVFGDLKVDGDLSISNLDIDTAEFITLNVTSNITVNSNVNIHNDLTVNGTIKENQRTLAQKYASISQINKHTDLIISKMTDREDVRELYSNMPDFFESNLILAYDFDFNVDNIDDEADFFSNNIYVSQLNTNTEPIYSTFSQYSIVPNINKDYPIDYYGTKYVKGNSSLYCGSNIFNSDGIDYYKFNTQRINDAYFTSSKSYTIAFWIRFNEINRNQYIFNFGVPANFSDQEYSINLSLNTSNNLHINVVNENRSPDDTISNNIEELEFEKDEWYHIVLILKNNTNISLIPKNTIDNSNLLIQYFKNLGYTNDTNSSDNFFTFTPQSSKSTIFTYVNGIILNTYDYNNHTIFGNSSTSQFINYFGVLNSSTTTDYLNGYIDDFKMYQTVVPINYINEYIIGDALIIKPGLLSAIGNYGINIINFTNIVSVGNCNNDVDLHIYGLLKIEDTKLTISNCDIDVIRDTLTTSNFAILETLDVSNINVSNIEIYDLISGPDFHLGSSNFINNIEIDHLSNINLNSSNITANTITVNNELNLKNATLSNINVVGINIDNTFSISDNDIKIRSHLIIGDNSSKDRRYDFESLLLLPSRKVSIKNVADPNYYLYSNFNLYNDHYEQFPIITPTDDIQIFDKSIIFYGNTNEDDYDIHFKNNYIRNENCNIKDEINKSYAEGEGEDRNRTRIKLDVGNIKLQNGFIELKHKDILEYDEPSTLKIEENQISITSNVNTTILNNSLMLSNINNYCNCVLTNSNFMFNNGNGFTDDETLRIKTIVIEDEISKSYAEGNGEDRNRTRINLDVGNIKLQNGFIELKHKDILEDDEPSTLKIEENQISITSNVNITILNDSLMLSNNDNHCNCLLTNSNFMFNNGNGFIDNETLRIKTIVIEDEIRTDKINTLNPDSNIISINTSNEHNPYGKIQGFLCSNSKIDIQNEIITHSNIKCEELNTSNINVSNIICEYNIGFTPDFTSNTKITRESIEVQTLQIYGSIILGHQESSGNDNSINGGFGSLSIKTINTTNRESDVLSIDTSNANNPFGKIQGFLYSNSKIDINNEIRTNSNIYCVDLESSNIRTTGNIDASNIEVSNITVNTITVNAELNVSNIIASNIDCSETIQFSNIISSNITVNNTLLAPNIQGINEGLCSIEGILENNSIININCNITTKQDIFSEYQYTSNTLCTSNIRGLNGELCSIVGKLESNSEINISNDIRTSGSLRTSNTLYVSNIESINKNRCSIVGSLNGDSIIDISGDITTTGNIDASNIEVSNITVNTITVNAELNVSNIIASNIDCSDKIDSSNIISSNITVNNTLFAPNIQGINEGLCSIEGILENNSIIYINCNITTKQGIFSEYQYTSNTLCTSNIRGLNEYLCSIVGKLESNSEINISNDIRTSGSLRTSNTLYVSNIESINKNRCSIVGSLNGDSIIDINGDIETLTNIRGNHLYIDNIYSKNFGNEIIFNNDTVNSNVTRCIELKVEQISSFDSIDKIKIYNDIIIENEQYGEKEPFVILTSANIIIKDIDQNTEFKFETNKISYNGNDKNTNIIEIDSSSDVTINCDILNVTQIDFESDQFEFDKIITYTRNANSDPDKQWPNVYIGFNTEFEKRQADRNDNNYLDVLYVDTPDNSRLKTGNILIQKELTIDDEDDSTVNFKIITKNSYTYFKNHNNFELLVFSLKNKSIGINTKPPDIDNIKLFVKDGGIQTTGDIIAFANISDKRFKMNITPFNTNDGIDIINKLNPVKFRWKADLFNTTMANKDDIGFIAQEVAEIIPEAVAKCKIEMNDIDYNYINYERIIPYLVNNIKYLNNKIVELEDKLNGI